MSIVFATPMYGGQCTKEYFHSALELRGALTIAGINHCWLTQENDSLITRARNCLIARFMRDPELREYKAFMFIDADIQFVPEDVAKLWNLFCEGREVVTACYPTKIEKAANTTAWKDGDLVNIDNFDKPVPIDYAGTGFILLARTALEKLQEAYPETRHKEGKVGEVYALCDTMVTKEDNWEDRWYVSEDYLLCQRWRDIGGEIILDPSIKLGHVGRKVFR